ncbi:MAG: hypothetical protein M5U31_04545 [Acidimicrobiia bacterium]|nr:hypothetical protein [Acidimicrobiia bacterium]
MARDLSDPGEVQELNFGPTRALRYAELAIVGDEYVTFYNCTGLSEAPPDQWEAIDADAAAQKFGAAMVIKNGPHWWACDSVTLHMGTEVLEVEGIGFRWAANISVEIVSSGGLAANKRYDPAESSKEGELVYKAGRSVYELVAPGGEVYLMQSSAIEIDGFETLGDRLTLPDGWSYRSRTLDADFTYVMDGAVSVVMDDLGNVYNLVK